MFVFALVSGIVIETIRATPTKRSILLATLQAEHFRLLRPSSSGRRSNGRPTRPRSARRRPARAPLALTPRSLLAPAPCRGRRRDRGD
jgi:hypothetical protein